MGEVEMMRLKALTLFTACLLLAGSTVAAAGDALYWVHGTCPKCGKKESYQTYDLADARRQQAAFLKDHGAGNFQIDVIAAKAPVTSPADAPRQEELRKRQAAEAVDRKNQDDAIRQAQERQRIATEKKKQDDDDARKKRDLENTLRYVHEQAVAA